MRWLELWLKKKDPKRIHLKSNVSFTSDMLLCGTHKNTGNNCLENPALAAGLQSILKEYSLRQSRGMREGGAFETREASDGASTANTGRERD